MKTLKTLALSAVVLATSLNLALADKLVVKGSDTLGAELVPQLAAQFQRENPGITFDIAAEGSSTGLAAIIDGTADIGMSSRRATSAEVQGAIAKSRNLDPTVVVYDGIAVIVNAKNPVKGLTKKQVEQIFTGDITDWSAVGGAPGKISVYTRNTASGTYADFKAMAMRKREYAPSSQKMAGNQAIASEVGSNPNGIGYCGLAFDTARGVKALPVDGSLPSVASIKGKIYAYSRPTFFYTNGKPSGAALKFIQFTLGPSGQAIARKVGFVPL